MYCVRVYQRAAVVTTTSVSFFRFQQCFAPTLYPLPWCLTRGYPRGPSSAMMSYQLFSGSFIASKKKPPSSPSSVKQDVTQHHAALLGKGMSLQLWIRHKMGTYFLLVICKRWKLYTDWMHFNLAKWDGVFSQSNYGAISFQNCDL